MRTQTLEVIGRAARAAAYAADAAANAAVAARAAYAAANAADAARTARAAAYAAANAAGAAADASLAAAFADGVAEAPDADLFQIQLWPDGRQPDEITSALIVHPDLLDSGPVWSFWQRWYRGMLDGQPIDWKLQEEVALIPREEWEKGPEHIAREIEKIEARFALEAKLSELEISLANASTDRHGIGGNLPPDAIDDAPQFSKEYLVVWEPIRELKSEATIEKPEPGRIGATISKLVALLSVCGKWTGEKLDAAAQEYAKTIGKTAGAATLVWLASHHPQIASLIEAAKRWLVSLF